MGKFSKIAEETGLGLPADEERTVKDDLGALLELSRSQNSRARPTRLPEPVHLPRAR